MLNAVILTSKMNGHSHPSKPMKFQSPENSKAVDKNMNQKPLLQAKLQEVHWKYM